MKDTEKPKQLSSEIQVTDKRFWVEDETAIEKATIPEKKYPSFVEALKARTEAAEKKLHEKIEALDKENAAFRKRQRSQLEQRLFSGKGEILSELLEVADNLERALEGAASPSSFEALQEGVKLNLGLLLSKFRTLGVEPIETLGQPFDPNYAEAVGTVEVEDPALEDKVLEVLQKGYRLEDQLLRPARVKVGRLRQ